MLTYGTVWRKIAFVKRGSWRHGQVQSRPKLRKSRRKPASRPDRLDAPAWIAAAFDTLADHGIDAVRVEPLAKALAVTKGSFYWHFADRRALIDAMLAQWSEARIEAIRGQAGGAGSPTVILLRLADLYTRHGNVRGLAIELAIRAFARSDEGAAKAVRAVDSERLKHVAALFERLGWPAGDASARAVSVLQLSVRPEPARSEAGDRSRPSTLRSRRCWRRRAEPFSASRTRTSRSRGTTKNADHVGDGRDERAGRQRRIDAEPRQRERNHDPAQSGRRQHADHRQPDDDAEVV